MTAHAQKLVLIVDPTLPLGVIANTCALLAISIGRHVPELIGPDLSDASGSVHLGLFDRAITVLAAPGESLGGLRSAARSADLLVVDFTTLPQQARTYDEYAALLENTSGEDLSYLGLAVYGPSKSVTRVTGSLPLLRERVPTITPS